MPAAAAGDVADPAGLWADQILPALTGLTKAMYQSADLLGIQGSVATVRVDNDHHRQNCDRKRPDVERALTDQLGRPVTVRFEISAEGAVPARSAPPGARPEPIVKSDDPDEHLAGADVHDLDDAPDAPAGGLAALTEAFPGAELLEET